MIIQTILDTQTDVLRGPGTKVSRLDFVHQEDNFSEVGTVLLKTCSEYLRSLLHV